MIKNRWTVVALVASVAAIALGLTPWGGRFAPVFWGVALALQSAAVAVQLTRERPSRRDVHR